MIGGTDKHKKNANLAYHTKIKWSSGQLAPLHVQCWRYQIPQYFPPEKNTIKKELCKCINTYGHLIYVFDNEKSYKIIQINRPNEIRDVFSTQNNKI
jgi:hypothetical protein